MEQASKEVSGWTGSILRVDLNRREVSVHPWERSWIGGKAYGAWLVFEEEPEGCDEYDPRRVLVFTTGPLTGTIAPASSRGNVCSRNLVSGGISTSSIGGFFPAEMKYAGYDHLLVKGKADSPVYLLVQDDRVRILDASRLWGKTTWETDSLLKERHGDPELRTVCIGPAGENRVRSACIVGDRNRAASWGGNGALMGAKNLKAIAVRGTRPIRIARPEAFLAAAGRTQAKAAKTFGSKLLRRGGTVGLIGSELNPLTTKNYRDDFWEPEKVDKVSYKAFRKRHKARPVACLNCNIACGRFLEIDEGPHAGIRMDGVQLNALRGFASNLDITSPDAVIAANAVVNQFGLGIDGIASIAGWVLDCFERGILTEEDLGYEVAWGDLDAFLRICEDVAYRRGLGDLLAGGVGRAAASLKQGSERAAVLVKGVELNEGRMRSNRAWSLGIMTSPRGGGHLDGAPAMEGVGFDEAVSESAYGITNASDPTAYDQKAAFVVHTERLKMLVDSLGVCTFTSVWGDPHGLNADDYAELYAGATGDDGSAAELLETAEKALNVQKAFNTIHAGFTREDDFPPPRLQGERIRSGPFKGTGIDRERWGEMLSEYYRLHGWDGRTGLQGKGLLQRLGLDEVADRLAAAGRLEEGRVGIRRTT